VIVDDFSTTIYDGRLKEERVRALLPKAKVVRGDMADGNWFWRVTEEIRPEAILHFAAIAGIRYAQKDPFAVIRANVTGTASVFEAVKRVPVKRIVYASTSSVYGRNQKVPFHEDDPIQLPSSLYAATKRECELLAEVYRHTSEVQSIGLRFFTVYGPWGRPDHAIWLFTKAILTGLPFPYTIMGTRQGILPRFMISCAACSLCLTVPRFPVRFSTLAIPTLKPTVTW